jgi:hypothetical protein
MNLLGDLDPELAGDEKLAALVQEIRAFATGPAPHARPALVAVLTRGVAGLPGQAGPPLPPPAPVTSRRRLGERLQTSRARLVLGGAVASVGLLSTGAAGALPGPAQSAFARTAAAVGLELPEATRGRDAAPGPADSPPEVPAGGGAQDDQADDASTGTELPSEPPAPPVDERLEAGGTSGEVPPASTGGDTDRGGSPSRAASDKGVGGRPLPAPTAPQRPELGGDGPGEPAPRPAAPGLSTGGRPDGVPGRADDGDEQEEEEPGRPGAPVGELPGNPGHGTDLPAEAGPADLLPPR